MLLARVIMGSFVEESDTSSALKVCTRLHVEKPERRSRGHYRETLTNSPSRDVEARTTREISENRKKAQLAKDGDILGA